MQIGAGRADSVFGHREIIISESTFCFCWHAAVDMSRASCHETHESCALMIERHLIAKLASPASSAVPAVAAVNLLAINKNKAVGS